MYFFYFFVCKKEMREMYRILNLGGKANELL